MEKRNGRRSTALMEEREMSRNARVEEEEKMNNLCKSQVERRRKRTVLAGDLQSTWIMEGNSVTDNKATHVACADMQII